MMNANLILLSKISLMVVGKKDNFVDPVIHNNDNDNNNDIIAIGYTQRMAFALKARKIISESKRATEYSNYKNCYENMAA